MTRTGVIVAGVTAVLVIAVGGSLVHRHTLRKSWRKQCRNNLLGIAEPLHCCIPREKGLKPGASIKPEQLATYIWGGRIPKCPSGCEYNIPFVVDGHPTCPYHGDLLATPPTRDETK
jgi:hypothetical protein